MSRFTGHPEKTFLFTVATLVLVFAMAEAIVRLVVPPAEYGYRFGDHAGQRDLPEFYLRDPHLFWTLRPNAAVYGSEPMNRLGYRGKERDVQRTPGTIRVVTLGDSCTFGIVSSQRQTYPAVAERELNRRLTANRVEVLNGGVPGYSSWQALQALRRKWIDFAPDVVTFYLGWNDTAPAVFVADKDQTPLRNTPRGLHRILQQSRGYQVLREALLAGRAGPRVSPEDYAANLRAFAATCRKHGALPVAITCPASAPIPKIRPYNDAARQTAAQSEMALLDLASHPEMAARGLYMEDRHHPNAKGNRRIGRLLADFLCDTMPEAACATAPRRAGQSM